MVRKQVRDAEHDAVLEVPPRCVAFGRRRQ